MLAVIFESNLHQVIINVLKTVPTAAMSVARNNTLVKIKHATMSFQRKKVFTMIKFPFFFIIKIS